jgi:hypothetical protein
LSAALSGLALALSAAGSLSLDLSLRDELRTGTAVALGAGTSSVGLEDALIPSGQGTWDDGENKLSLRYNPELLIPDLGEGDHLQVLHRGLLEYDWSERSGSAHLTLSEEAEYGTIDLFGLTPSTGTNPTLPQLNPTQLLQPIPTVTGITYEASNSLADFRWDPSRRTTLDLGGGYRLNGGANAAAQSSFPLQQGPFANGSLGYAASRRDTLTTRLSVTDLGFSNGPRDLLLEADEEESSRLARHLVGTLGIGYAAVRYQADSQSPGQFNAYPEATASLVENLLIDPHRTLLAGLTASVAPLIDRLGGTVFESLQVLGRLEWNTTHGVSLRALAGFNQPLYGNLAVAQRIELAQGAMGYQPLPFLRFEAGGLGTWQQASIGGATNSQWLAFGAVVLQETLRK